MVGLSFLSGILLGLTASLHCVGMCGGIVSALILTPPTHLPGAVKVGLLHLGRILAYAGFGAAVGLSGPALYGHLDITAAHSVLRWASAAVMVWIGFSVTGLLPPISLLDRWARPITSTVCRWQGHVPGLPWVGAVLSGMLWGLMPCAMVYAALITAMLAGGAMAGMLVMTGFGLGTVPAVSLAAFSMLGLRDGARSGLTRLVVGLAIIGLAPCTLLVATMTVGMLCVRP